jgi:hypothetical protein
MPESEESQTLKLEPDVIQQLAQFGADPDSLSADEVNDLLPSGLTSDQVNQVGLQISSTVEAMLPSRDGFSNGKRAETKALYQIGIVAVANKDFETAESVITNFKERPLGIERRIGTVMLKRALRRAKKDS